MGDGLLNESEYRGFMEGKQGKTRTYRELKHSNVWLDRRIRAIDENKYYITEDENE